MVTHHGRNPKQCELASSLGHNFVDVFNMKHASMLQLIKSIQFSSWQVYWRSQHILNTSYSNVEYHVLTAPYHRVWFKNYTITSHCHMFLCGLVPGCLATSPRVISLAYNCPSASKRASKATLYKHGQTNHKSPRIIMSMMKQIKA